MHKESNTPCSFKRNLFSWWSGWWRFWRHWWKRSLVLRVHFEFESWTRRKDTNWNRILLNMTHPFQCSGPLSRPGYSSLYQHGIFSSCSPQNDHSRYMTCDFKLCHPPPVPNTVCYIRCKRRSRCGLATVLQRTGAGWLLATGYWPPARKEPMRFSYYTEFLRIDKEVLR